LEEARIVRRMFEWVGCEAGRLRHAGQYGIMWQGRFEASRDAASPTTNRRGLPCPSLNVSRSRSASPR
jgi:hypothetical protein